PKTEAIVLKSFDYRETSRIVTFFTKDYGKISGILKGIRKDPKKFGSSVDRFSINDLVYYHYRKSDLHLVSHCDLKQYYFPIRQDYKKNLAANYVLELVDTIMHPEDVNKKVYQLILDYLDSLQTVDDISKLVHMFQIKILVNSGFRPHIDTCVLCRKRVKGRVRFSMRLGGLVCPDCPTRETSFTVISQGTIASMIHIEEREWNQALRLGLTTNARKELKFILNNFLIYHLEKKIKAQRFMDESEIYGSKY
ncbi:MAG: DNA repair protein RecO, partial [Candidatus Omnitrophica bacterium]|nr:DNA repair protein RecO [Candidatus Omnitrophota bacterium]